MSTSEYDFDIIIPPGLLINYCLVKLVIVLYNVRIETRRNNCKHVEHNSRQNVSIN